MRVWGDENDEPGGEETHFFRVNVVPYWEWNGNRLSKDSDCRDTTANAPTVDEITDADCIVTQFGNTAELRFFNVINEHFNVYVGVNGTNVISEPSTTDLGSFFTVNLDAGDNLIRIRLAAKGSQPLAEVYDSDSFYYKVTAKDVLVSNLGQTTRGVTRHDASYGTRFTTGNNEKGYTISAVRLGIRVPTGATPKVSLYSDSSGAPDSSLKELTNPSNFSTTATTEVEFGADNYRLKRNTPYWIVIEDTAATDTIRLDDTASTSEDAGGAPGWSIGNVSRALLSGSWQDFALGQIIQIGIKGALSTVSTDATLSGLLLDSTLAPTSISLTPAFDSEVTEYTATFANQYSDATFQVNTNDDNATVEFLDENDATIPTTRTTPPNIHYLASDLAEGANIFKIKVTAEDGTTTKTYQVTVTRVDFLVSNLGQATNDPGTINATHIEFATPFTTGGNPTGYTLSAVTLDIGVSPGTTPLVSIYSDSSGRPGSSLRVLTNPTTIPPITDMQVSDGEMSTRVRELDFEADDLKLKPATTYWVVIARASGTGSVFIDETSSSAEDIGSAPGWSIGDFGYFLTSGQTWPTADLSLEAQKFEFTRMAVKGAVVVTPGAPASLTATPGDTEATLTWTAPPADGGHPITKYQYRVSTDGGSNWAPDWTDVPDGSDTGTDQAEERTLMVTGLANGTLHTFQVRAVNSEASGSEVEATATPTPTATTTVPGAPASLTATPGNAQVTLHWTPPASDGGAAITKYQYRVSVDGGTTWAPDWTDVPDGSDAGSDQADERTVTVISLANGTLHTFQVRAVNSEGSGGEADATRGDTDVDLRWTPPASDGGAAVIKYQYRVSADGGTTWAPDWTDVPDGSDAGSDQADERTVTVISLANGTLHTFQVRAVNSEGSGGEADATRGDTEVDLRWTPPASDGGAAVIKYQYRVSADGGTTWAPDWTDVPDGSDAGSDQADERTVTVISLANGTLHTFQVRAVNSEGSGGEADATRGDTEVDLRWTPPASDGGAAVIKYQYRVSADGGTTWAPDWTDVPDGSDTGTDLDDERTLTVTSLTNEMEHTFQVPGALHKKAVLHK